MMNSRSDLLDLLRPTLLGGHEVEEHQVEESREISFELALAGVDGTPPVAWQDAWPVAREVVSQTGRWPIAFDFLAIDSPYDRQLFGEPEDARSPEALIAAARGVSAADAEERCWRREDATTSLMWDQVVETHLGYSALTIGRTPDTALVRDVPVGDTRALERRLLDWEEGLAESPKAEDPAIASGEQDYVNPRFLLFLPTPVGFESLAFVHYYGGGESVEQQVDFIALARSWGERFGAELQHNSSQTLDFEVTAPPTTLDEAFELATQIDLFSTSHDTMIRTLARSLLGNRHWRLHRRP